MFDPDIQRKAISLIMGFIMEFSGVSSEPEPIELTADNLNVSTVSVSCLKVSWDSEPNRDSSVSCTSHDDNYAYGDNMYFAFKGNDLCYITGLRENTEYTVTVEPILSEEESRRYGSTLLCRGKCFGTDGYAQLRGNIRFKGRYHNRNRNTP